MKILVIDDTEIQREAAKAQLKDYDLTVVGSFGEARELLQPIWPYGADPVKYPQYPKEYRHPFEVVLTDFMMPLKKGSDQLMPVGLYMAFLAASKGAKRVGIVSDLDGHDQIVHDLIRPFAEMHFVQPHQMCGARITTYGYTTLTMRVRPDNLVDEVKPESYSQASFRAFLGETLVVKCWDIALKSLLKD